MLLNISLPQVPRTVLVRVGCFSVESADYLEGTLFVIAVPSDWEALCDFSLY